MSTRQERSVIEAAKAWNGARRAQEDQRAHIGRPHDVEGFSAATERTQLALALLLAAVRSLDPELEAVLYGRAATLEAVRDPKAQRRWLADQTPALRALVEAGVLAQHNDEDAPA